MDGPLDFEFDDPVRASPVSTKKRKKKLIGLDDLVTDFYKEKNELIDKEAERAKSRKNYNSDEDQDFIEAELSKCVDKCQEQMGEISGEDDTLLWGLHVFGKQKFPPSSVIPDFDFGSCELLNSFTNNDVNSMIGLDNETGETFLESLMVDGWLLKLARTRGHVENSIAAWAFNLLLYSSREMLRTSACDFWCAILSPLNEIKLKWLPNYTDIKGAMETYGFLWDSSPNCFSNSEVVNADCKTLGPPQNIRAWIRFMAAAFKTRNIYSMFSVSEAQDLVTVIICLFLDRQLLGLSVILYECMISAISFFEDTEWSASCEKIAISLACRVPKDVNCLRAVESISGVDERSTHLRSAVAFQILITCFDNKLVVEDAADEILRMLTSMNVKEKSCDLLKMYMYLVLTENWLLSTTPTILEDKPVMREMWGLCLRNCSCQIASTDLRPYAAKVRSKASYLLQRLANK